MEGYLWYYSDKIYGGSKEDYLSFLRQFPDCQFITVLQTESFKMLQLTTSNLNQSNLLTALKAVS